MKNREKYKNELVKVCKSGELMKFFNDYVVPTYKCDNYAAINAEKVALLTSLWLDEEYQEPKVDWSKIEVDTPILVSIDDNRWYHRHFAEYRDGRVCAFNDGATSWTNNVSAVSTGWEYAKLAEPQKTEHDGCVGCKYEHFEADQEPCKDCQHAYIDQYKPKEEIK